MTSIKGVRKNKKIHLYLQSKWFIGGVSSNQNGSSCSCIPPGLNIQRTVSLYSTGIPRVL